MLNIFYSNGEKFIDQMLKHAYSKSITSVLNLILNIRKDAARNVFNSYKSRRVTVLNSVLSTVLETCGDIDKLEVHLSTVNILGDTIQNSENILDGKAIVKEVFFAPENFVKIVECLADEKKKNLGHLPNLLHLIFEFSKKNDEEYDECRLFLYSHPGGL